MGILSACKPLIGVVHLPPLPGSYAYRRRPYPYPHGSHYGIEEIVEHAVREASIYREAGFDAVIIENFGDKPYKHDVGPIETAAMARIVAEVRRRVPIPVGVNLLRNSPHLALAVAHISGASFIRANSLCETRYSVEGVLQPRMRELARVAMELDIYDDLLSGRIEILADIDVKHSTPATGEGDLGVLMKDCIERAGFPIHAVIVTGPSTGLAPESSYVEMMAEHARRLGAKLLIGSGVRPDNIAEYWRLSDGFIVGTSVKLGEVTENVVSLDKATKLAEIVKRYREVWPCKSPRRS